LKQTQDYGIMYGTVTTPLEGYADSDYAADPDSRALQAGRVPHLKSQ
jgi:hypothetical protein